MKMGTIGLVKLFITHAKDSHILELDKNDLRENFFQFTQSEKYGDLLKLYPYDEQCHMCPRFEYELASLICEKQITEYKTSFYIYGVNSELQKSYSKETNDTVRQMVTDYVQMNMQKQKAKMD